MNKNNKSLIISSSLIIIGTSIGAGILALPLETGLAGFLPSFFCFVLMWATMTISGWVLFLRFYKNKGTVTNIAMLYHHELGPWAKHLNSISYFLTFYGLLIAYMSGASSTITHLFDDLATVPHIGKIITILFFIFSTSLIVFGKRILNRSNTLLSILLFVFFFTLVILTLPYIQSSNLSFHSWENTTLALPILATAFGYHPVIPVIYEYAEDKDLAKKNYFQILIIGTIVVFIFNLVWSIIVMGILPIHASDGISISAALSKGIPATVPIAKLINSKTLILVSLLFSIFAITTSYIGVGAGLLNYIEGLLFYYIKPSKMISLSITFLLPLILALIYPGVFIKLLSLVGGIGVITSCGILPVLLGLKHDNPLYIKVLSCLVLVICIIVFIVECFILLN
jgi:tyrosine-specific transport protein